ncbi:MAG TPA: hypothetical protein VFP65_24350 [Anaeromyxobacteraceae bacterium]|nr:hypothetical protein [Anaeromyxobacteraceae bacterium]
MLVVVQDHPLREAMRDALVGEGFEVSVAASFEHGAGVVREAERGCVVVIDHPRTGGEAAACRELLREGEGRCTLVWVASAPPSEALADPRVPVVLMPFTSDELAGAVDKAMICLGGGRRS